MMFVVFIIVIAHFCTGVASTGILAGAHYFSGWFKPCNNKTSNPNCYSHFHGFTPTGQVTKNWFPNYPERTPLLGMLTTNETTVANDVFEADKALDFFDILYYDGGPLCGTNPQDEHGLSFCLNTALAFMLNSTSMWKKTTGRLHFFISYSNDIDRHDPNCFANTTAGNRKWKQLVHTWTLAMGHPRYLKINNRPVFKILIPDIFISECGGDATLATARLNELRAAAVSLNLSVPLIGGGWENPSIPNVGNNKKTLTGYVRYNTTAGKIFLCSSVLIIVLSFYPSILQLCWCIVIILYLDLLLTFC
jgi:hypothetical protein